MAASLSYCRYCPIGKRENKRISRKEIQIYHKLIRRINKEFARKEMNLYYEN